MQMMYAIAANVESPAMVSVLRELPMEEYKKISDLYDEGLYDAISLVNCVRRRTSEGGTGAASVNRQIAFVEEFVK